MKDEIGDVFPWERVEEEDDVVPRYEGRVNLCTTDDETYTREDLGRAADRVDLRHSSSPNFGAAGAF